MSCGVGPRRGLDSLLLWCRPAAVAPIWSLIWELPYAMGAALQQTKKSGNSMGRSNQILVTEQKNFESFTTAWNRSLWKGSCCGTVRSGASQQCQDAGFTSGPAQWVKKPSSSCNCGLGASGAQIWSLAQKSLCCGVAKKERKVDGNEGSLLRARILDVNKKQWVND